MKKNVIALFCAAVLLICLLPVGSTGVVSANTTQQYHVGYSIKNINPWVSSSFDIEKDLGKAVFVDPSTPNKKIYPSL